MPKWDASLRWHDGWWRGVMNMKNNFFAIISREIDGKISLLGKVAALIIVAWVIWKFLVSVEIVVASLAR